jgi:hypothetical protein
MEGTELAAVLGTIVTSFAGGVFGLGKWLGKHVDKQVSTQHSQLGQQRQDFLASLAKRDEQFIAALGRQESECARQRELDREERVRERESDRQQRAEDRAALLRMIGLATSGDTGAFRTQSHKPMSVPRRKNPSEDASGSKETTT